jgi:hypothetical protein
MSCPSILQSSICRAMLVIMAVALVPLSSPATEVRAESVSTVGSATDANSSSSDPHSPAHFMRIGVAEGLDKESYLKSLLDEVRTALRAGRIGYRGLGMSAGTISFTVSDNTRTEDAEAVVTQLAAPIGLIEDEKRIYYRTRVMRQDGTSFRIVLEVGSPVTTPLSEHDRAVRKRPTAADPLINRGIHLLSRSTYADHGPAAAADLDFAAAIKINPLDPYPRFFQIRANIDQFDVTNGKGTEFLETALQLSKVAQEQGIHDPYFAFLEIALIEPYLTPAENQGEPGFTRDRQAAINLWSEVVKGSPEFHVLRAVLGAQRLEAGDAQGAIPDLEAGLADLDNPAFWQGLADRGVFGEPIGPPPGMREAIEKLLEKARLAAASPGAKSDQAPSGEESTEPAGSGVTQSPSADSAPLSPQAAADALVSAPTPKADGSGTAVNKSSSISPSNDKDNRRVALVIGNAAYRNVAILPNPHSDADLVANTFKIAGFDEVLVFVDQDRAGLVGALRAFGELADGADWAVVYFAGHGIEVAGQNFLIPVDAALQRERDVGDEAISVERVIASTEGAQSVRMVILDACRDNPFATRMVRSDPTRSASRGLARIEPEASTLVLFAAREGTTAADGTGPNSPFAEAFARQMAVEGVEVGLALRRLSADVFRATGRKQEPVAYGRLPEKELFFVRLDAK